MMSQEEKCELKLLPYYSVSVCGRNFQEVAFNTSKVKENDVHTHFYNGGEGIDFYLWLDKNNNIIRQQMNFLGQITEWNIVEGLKTGYSFEAYTMNTESTEQDINNVRSNNDKIIFDESPILQTLSFSLELIKNMDVIQPKMKSIIINNYKYSPRISTTSSQHLKYSYLYGNEPKTLGRFSLKNLWKAFVRAIKKNRK